MVNDGEPEVQVKQTYSDTALCGTDYSQSLSTAASGTKGIEVYTPDHILCFVHTVLHQPSQIITRL